MIGKLPAAAARACSIFFSAQCARSNCVHALQSYYGSHSNAFDLTQGGANAAFGITPNAPMRAQPAQKNWVRVADLSADSNRAEDR